MHDKYLVLSTIYQIVKDDDNPTSFPCNTRDIILRYQGPWPSAQLDELEKEGLIEMRRLERVLIYITKKGIEEVLLQKHLHE